MGWIWYTCIKGDKTMFDKTIVNMWEKDGFTYLISIDDSGTLFITERRIEVIK